MRFTKERYLALRYASGEIENFPRSRSVTKALEEYGAIYWNGSIYSGNKCVLNKHHARGWALTEAGEDLLVKWRSRAK